MLVRQRCGAYRLPRKQGSTTSAVYEDQIINTPLEKSHAESRPAIKVETNSQHQRAETATYIRKTREANVGTRTAQQRSLSDFGSQTYLPMSRRRVTICGIAMVKLCVSGAKATTPPAWKSSSKNEGRSGYSAALDKMIRSI